MANAMFHRETAMNPQNRTNAEADILLDMETVPHATWQNDWKRIERQPHTDPKSLDDKRRVYYIMLVPTCLVASSKAKKAEVTC